MFVNSYSEYNNLNPQEYAFSPSAQPVDLSSGESRDVSFEAIRVAYRYLSFLGMKNRMSRS